MRRIINILLHNGITAPAVSVSTLTEDFQHLSLLIFAIGATANIKVKVSNSDVVNFAAASTVTNRWYYVDMKGLGDGAATVVGTTGLALTLATSQRGYAINVDEAKWVAVDVEALSAGSISVSLTGATNN